MKNLDGKLLKHTRIELLMGLGLNLPRHQKTSWGSVPAPCHGRRQHARPDQFAFGAAPGFRTALSPLRSTGRTFRAPDVVPRTTSLVRGLLEATRLPSPQWRAVSATDSPRTRAISSVSHCASRRFVGFRAQWNAKHG